jgi:hypothetical protein
MTSVVLASTLQTLASTANTIADDDAIETKIFKHTTKVPHPHPISEKHEVAIEIPIVASKHSKLLRVPARSNPIIPIPSATYDCPICLEKYPASLTLKLDSCNHVFCKHCLELYLKIQMDTKTHIPYNCPMMDCKRPLLDIAIAITLKPNDYQLFIKLKKLQVLEETLNTKTCAKCKRNLIADRKKPWVMCECGEQICSRCGEMWHPMQSCNHVVSKKFRKQGYYGKIRLCPRCGYKIVKEGGCSHVYCKCGCCFCWSCGKELAQCKCDAMCCLMFLFFPLWIAWYSLMFTFFLLATIIGLWIVVPAVYIKDYWDKSKDRFIIIKVFEVLVGIIVSPIIPLLYVFSGCKFKPTAVVKMKRYWNEVKYMFMVMTCCR